jgi:large subunit ribosomal protein L14
LYLDNKRKIVFFYKQMLIFVGTKLKVVDNSGATLAKCIEIYKTSKYYGASVGTVVLVSLKNVVPNRKIKKGDLAKAVIVRSKRTLFRVGGHSLHLSDNAIILLHNNSLLPRAKRSKTPLVEEIRFSFVNGLKVLSLAPIVI